ncbi:acetyl-CoA carboxylase biotin carboxylase subunit family protein [Streptomyces sp. NPDC021224]|uniref:ATP-grasp domain-containing protein n=1 Tax=unclassified Streptomyces TaxID=2593676 RepID=UPI0037A86150
MVIDASEEVARAATASGLRPIFVQQPGAAAEDLVDDMASLYTVDFTDEQFPSFVAEVLGPLRPSYVVSVTERGAAAAAVAHRILQLPDAPTALLGGLREAAEAAWDGSPRDTVPHDAVPGRSARPGVLLISHHPYTFFSRGGRNILPSAEVDVHLVTRNAAWGGVRGLTANPLSHVAVCDIDDEDQWQAICEWWVANRPVARVVAVHERAVLPAAELRTKFGLPGMQYDTALLFRDKVRMKQAVAEAGAARVPAFTTLDDPADLDSVDWGTGRKVIKNRGELAARDVHVVDSREAALRVCDTLDLSGSRYEIEEFVEGGIYHCDSVVRDGRIVFSSVGRYLANPAAYAPGGFFGTVLVTEGALPTRIRQLNERVLAALGMESGTTHLELFHTPDDELVFCEIAGRPPGGIIPPVIEGHYGFNIVEADIRLQSGLDFTLPDTGTPRSGGACGFIAFYPGGGDRRGIPEESSVGDFVLEHIHQRGAGDGEGGVRHSTDFLDSYVVGAPDAETLMQRIEAVKREYWRR